MKKLNHDSALYKAGLLGILPGQVGITATTGEGLTDFGKGLGVSVFCIITVGDRNDI